VDDIIVKNKRGKINKMKKYKGLIIMLMVSICLFSICGCNKQEEVVANSYEQISAEEAKKIMDTEKDYVILDVREADEYEEGHIENAVLLPHEDIKNKAEDVIPDKDKLILVYCRSGRRSKIAAEALVDLGYTNVKEFGGIIDWPYEIVK
jgi:rhodanese-related sulfurtransferase